MMQEQTPSVAECFDLMERYGMLANIRAHSIVVTRIARLLATALIEKGLSISVETVVAGAMLHDIGKTHCLDNDDDHAAMGRTICRENNLVGIGEIVGEHVWLRDYVPGAVITEKELVYYADKRVNHEEIVSLTERYNYIADRYGGSNLKRREGIRISFDRCREIEGRIFAGLPFGPDNLAAMLAAADTTAPFENLLEMTGSGCYKQE